MCRKPFWFTGIAVETRLPRLGPEPSADRHSHRLVVAIKLQGRPCASVIPKWVAEHPHFAEHPQFAERLAEVHPEVISGESCCWAHSAAVSEVMYGVAWELAGTRGPCLQGEWRLNWLAAGRGVLRPMGLDSAHQVGAASPHGLTDLNADRYHWCMLPNVISRKRRLTLCASGECDKSLSDDSGQRSASEQTGHRPLGPAVAPLSQECLCDGMADACRTVCRTLLAYHKLVGCMRGRRGDPLRHQCRAMFGRPAPCMVHCGPGHLHTEGAGRPSVDDMADLAGCAACAHCTAPWPMSRRLCAMRCSGASAGRCWIALST